jgi:hypothetical protein
MSKRSWLVPAKTQAGEALLTLSPWRQEFLERAPQLFEQPSNHRESEERVAELERMVGRLAMQLEAAKKVFGVSSFPTREND